MNATLTCIARGHSRAAAELPLHAEVVLHGVGIVWLELEDVQTPEYERGRIRQRLRGIREYGIADAAERVEGRQAIPGIGIEVCPDGIEEDSEAGTDARFAVAE